MITGSATAHALCLLLAGRLGWDNLAFCGHSHNYLYNMDIFILRKRDGSRYHTSAELLGKLGVILAEGKEPIWKSLGMHRQRPQSRISGI